MDCHNCDFYYKKTHQCLVDNEVVDNEVLKNELIFCNYIDNTNFLNLYALQNFYKKVIKQKIKRNKCKNCKYFKWNYGFPWCSISGENCRSNIYFFCPFLNDDGSVNTLGKKKLLKNKI